MSSELEKQGFDHPCKDTCSGWQQGYDRAKIALETRFSAIIDDLSTQIKQRNSEIGGLMDNLSMWKEEIQKAYERGFKEAFQTREVYEKQGDHYTNEEHENIVREKDALIEHLRSDRDALDNGNISLNQKLSVQSKLIDELESSFKDCDTYNRGQMMKMSPIHYEKLDGGIGTRSELSSAGHVDQFIKQALKAIAAFRGSE